jgi:hypothetical protein
VVVGVVVVVVVDDVFGSVEVVFGDVLGEGAVVGVEGTDVVVVVGATPVSGVAQSTGAVEVPVWLGIKTVPAQPKFEKWASRVTEPPSVKLTVEIDSRMNPEASIETSARKVVEPSPVKTPIALVMVLASSGVTPGEVAKEDGSIVNSYCVTATPSTFEVPTSEAAVTAGCTRSR